MRVITAPLRALKPSGAPAAERLVVAPQDLRTTDPTVASDIYAGYFAFSGKVVAAGGKSPFLIDPPSAAWAEGLMGFGWLRHLRAAESALARANARALVDDWIGAWGRPRGVAWETGVMARRLISWLSQSPVILDGADRDFYRRFLRSIVRQSVRLQRQLGRTEDGERRLLGAIALAYVALCTGASAGAQRRASRQLADALERQILPDGGHVGRNPRTLVDLLTDLLPLRQVYANQGVEPPRALLNGIDRMMPMLRLFRHADGSLALFNGMSVTPADTLATLLAYTDARSQAMENAPHSGFQRIQARGALVIMDAGKPPPEDFSGRAHAGCLSFEFSDGPARIVVNCGSPPPGGDHWRQLARSTAAHSTVTVNDTSSCRFVQEGSPFLGSPILAGPRDVPMERIARREPDPPAIGIEASHDGYRAAFGVIHHRRVLAELTGERLTGEDRIQVLNARGSQNGPDAFAVRFHLHPTVTAERSEDGRSVRLASTNGPAWVFDAGGMMVGIEESIFFAAPDGARRSEQLVVHGAYRTTPVVEWRFTRETAAGRRGAAQAESAPADPA